jgi:hypothetical protein
MQPPRRSLWASFLLAIVLFASLGTSAKAGTYSVYGTCGNWTAWNTAPASLAVYPQCPGMIARNVGGAFSSPNNVQGGWYFSAPAGTEISSVSLTGELRGLNGWQTMGYATGGGAPGGSYTFLSCPGWTCQNGVQQLGTIPISHTAYLWLQLYCAASSCPNSGSYGGVTINDVSVGLSDYTYPTVGVTGGSLAAGGWHRGTEPITVDAEDNAGVKALRAYVDGLPRAEPLRPDCDYRLLVPCPNGGTTMQITTTGLADGPHTLTLEAVDAGDNATRQDMTIYTDNTAPEQPRAAAVAGSGAWRSQNGFAVSWTDPAQTAAPIVAADYILCPTGAPSSPSCVTGSRAGTSIAAIDDLQVPGPGDWTLRLWLRDAAGNEDPQNPVAIDGLRFDNTAPNVAIAPPDPNDPTLIHVLASDDLSGIAGNDVEIQRTGDSDWHSLPTTPAADGVVATVDDATLADGTYQIRARAVDAAGNERSTESLTTGAPAALALPLRIKTRLAVGKLEHIRAHSSRRGHPRYRRVLVGRPRTRYGRTILLHGRLTTPGANPVAMTSVEVWEQADLPGAVWTRIASVQTSRTGRFTYRALRGPSRLVQFRYGGTATIRPRSSTVELLVRGATTLRVNRHHLVNGEDITFRGAVQGRPMPAAGKLVELQVFTRGRWRTFAQPRASASTGHWHYRYRFDAIHGLERFRFRARVRKEQGYPYELGTSRSVAVTVRGL